MSWVWRQMHHIKGLSGLKPKFDMRKDDNRMKSNSQVFL